MLLTLATTAENAVSKGMSESNSAMVKPMIVGQRTRVRLRFPEMAHAFKPGHRIRLTTTEVRA